MMMVVMNVVGSEAHLVDSIKNTSGRRLASRPGGRRVIKSPFSFMETTETDNVLADFGKRVQRCYGCFIAYHLKDMYLGEDATFFCEHCKDDTMFHFSEFSQQMDTTVLKEVSEDDHHHH